MSIVILPPDHLETPTELLHRRWGLFHKTPLAEQVREIFEEDASGEDAKQPDGKEGLEFQPSHE